MPTLIELLQSHQPEDDAESRDLAAMREYAVTLAEPYARTQQPAHFTGSAVVVDPQGSRTCLIHHKRAGRWFQPGGHAEAGDGESIEATAIREASEETGLRVRLHPAGMIDVDAHRIGAK
jgi:8-oxo-dGTP pyrophosphatase MutT (NUDIX family)